MRIHIDRYLDCHGASRASVNKLPQRLLTARCVQSLHGMIGPACLLALLAFSASDSFASQRADYSNISAQFKTQDVVWDDAQSLLLGGVQMHTASFKSSLQADDVARQLSDSSNMFNRILTMPGQLVLSGMNGHWHWLAVIRVNVSGADGYVSAMQAATVEHSLSFPWALGHTPAMFSSDHVTDGGSVAQRVHRLSMSLHASRAQLMEQLTQHGWKRQTDPGDPDRFYHPRDQNWASHWRRANEQVFVMAITHDNASLIFTQHMTGGARR